MTIVRVGATKKYSDGWEAAFGKGKGKAMKVSASKKTTAKKVVRAKSSAKKKSTGKKSKK